MLAGPFWGSLTGALSNLITHTKNFLGWEVYLFALCNIATALITYLFVRLFPQELKLEYRQDKRNTLYTQPKSRKLNKIMGTTVALILLSFALCLAISILGGLISAFILSLHPSLAEGPYVSGILTSTMLLHGFSLILAEILGRIPINIIDRTISVFLGFGFALAVSRTSFARAFRSF